MKSKIMILTIVATLVCSNYAYASEERSHGEHGKTVVKVGNVICPVSGEKVGIMGPVTQYEYKGKIYNFCCDGCVATFKEDPEKYIKKVEKAMPQHNSDIREEGHEGHRHMMGERDEQMMEELGEKEAKQTAVKDIDPAAPVKEFALEAYQYAYFPESISVNKGDVVKIRATSRDVPHGIFIKEYGINMTVKKGAVKEIEFVADKEGSFDIICSVYCGRGHHSMKGKLIVEE